MAESEKRFDVPKDDKQLNPRLPYFPNLPVNDFCRDILENGGKQIWPKPRNAATEMDLFSIKWLKSEEIEALINKKIHANISTPEWLDKIRNLHARAVEFYEKELYRTPSKDIREYNFSSKKEVIDFIAVTSWESIRRQTYCNIIKIMFILSEFDSAVNLHELDEKAKNAIEKYFLPCIQIYDSWFPETCSTTRARITMDIPWWEHKIIDFMLKFRWKSDISSVIKMLYNPEYYSADLVGDAVGIEFAVEKESDILLIQYFFERYIYRTYWKNLSYTDKDILNPQATNEIHSIVDEDFLDGLQRAENFKKKNSGKSLRNFKANLELPVLRNPKDRSSQRIYTWFEVVWVLEQNRNNSWYSDHRIYDQFKRILTMIRLQWYITELYIKKVINELYNRYPEAQFSKEKVFEKYTWDLKKIYFPWKRTVYYTSPERYDTLSSKTWELYPKELSPGI